ncbi:hypothetical protein NFI96_021047, partial [Prochilodus magdalenae]
GTETVISITESLYQTKLHPADCSTSQFQYTADKNPNTISVTVSDAGTAGFTCAAYRQEYFIYNRHRSSYPPYYTEESGPAVITVEERPKSTVRVQPADHVVIGETVTLTCDIEGGGRWQYQWSKDNKALSDAREKKEYTISKADQSHRGRYTCKGTQSTERCCYSQTSDAVTLTVTARPKPTVKVQPAHHVLNGETVTLTCDIEGGGGWQYQWSKDNNPLSDARGKKEYIISKADQSHKGAYTCKGTQSTEPSYSQTSDAVTLTVTAETPKPELTSSHKGAALIGNPVVLYCKLDPPAGWKFYWSKHTQNSENETKTETPSYTISSVSVSDRGQYWCRAGRGDPVYYTHYSDALWINTTDLSPSVSLVVSPSRTQHFTTGSLSLSCKGQSGSTGWRVRRYTHSEKVSDCSSGWRSVTGSTCNISSLSPSHTGVYWCESESGEISSPVNITVHSESTLL